jgi:hypothetical protein
MKTDRASFLVQISGLTAALLAASVLVGNVHGAPGLVPAKTTTVLGFGPGITASPVIAPSAGPSGISPAQADKTSSPTGTGLPAGDVPRASAAPSGLVSGGLGLELGDEFVGWLTSVDGGDVVGEAVRGPTGPHMANLKYEEITVTFAPAAMNKDFYAWLADTLARKLTKKDGAVVTMDSRSLEARRLAFVNACITEIQFPSLDGVSKVPAVITVKFQPEYIRRGTGNGSSPTQSARQRPELANAFKVEIQGLDATRVKTVPTLVIKQTLQPDAVGELRDYAKTPPTLTLPNLVLTLRQSSAASFQTWYDDFLVKGNCGAAQEKKGSLQFLSADLQKPILTLSFNQLGIMRLAPERPQTPADLSPDYRIEMFCGEMSLVYQ